MIPVYKPYLPEDATEYACRALYRGDLAHGVEKQLAESWLASALNVNHVLLTCNGTAATHLIFRSLELCYPHVKNVVVPNNVYVAAWNAAFFSGHPPWNFVAVDADLKTWNADYESVEKHLMPDERTAFLIVHNLGNTVNVPALKRRFPRSVFIEDNCEGLFGHHEFNFTGTESLCASLSFFGNKTVTCGEGGAFITNDTNLYKWIKRIHSQGQTEEKFIHDTIAYNYRMSNLNAALLYGQLNVVDDILTRKRKIFDLYRHYLAGESRIHFQRSEPGTYHSCWMFGIRIERSGYKEIEKWLAEAGIECRPMFYPVTRHSHLAERFHLLGTRNAEQLSRECVVLPSYPELSERQIEYICGKVKEFISRNP